jgi:hypothetical protein
MTMRPSNVSKTALLCLLLGSSISACERDKAPAAQGPSPASTTQHLMAKVPSDWPSQVPVYPGATNVTAMKGNGASIVVQHVNDAPAKVLDFYKAQLSTMHLVDSVDKGATQQLTWSDDAQPPLRVRLNLGTTAGTNSTYATLRVTHSASDDAKDVATAAGQAGAAAQ